MFRLMHGIFDIVPLRVQAESGGGERATMPGDGRMGSGRGRNADPESAWRDGGFGMTTVCLMPCGE
jgi:hypothetical protein